MYSSRLPASVKRGDFFLQDYLCSLPILIPSISTLGGNFGKARYKRYDFLGRRLSEELLGRMPLPFSRVRINSENNNNLLACKAPVMRTRPLALL